DQALWLQAILQPHLYGRRESRLLGDALPLRHRPGAGDLDDRELSDRPHLATDAALYVHCEWPAPSRISGRVAGGMKRRVRYSLLSTHYTMSYFFFGFMRDLSSSRAS